VSINNHGITGQRIRAGKGHESIRREALQDTRLSFKATGILAYLLSLPDNWRTDAERLSQAKNSHGKAKEGREAMRAGLRELEDAGYLVRRKFQDGQGQWRWTWRYSDTPSDLREQDVSAGQTGDGLPDYGSPDDGSPVDIEVLEVEVLEKRTDTTFLSETPDGAPNQDSQDAKQQPPARPDVVQLCNRLRDLMIGNGCKPPTVGKQWETAARLLLDRDKRDLREALWMLGWCQRDEFWRTNVLSMPTFRARYDQLVLRAKAEVGRRRNGLGPVGDASGEPMVPVQVHRGGQRLVPARWFSVTAPPEDWDPAHDPFDRVPGPDLPDWHWRRHNEQ
jgi:hypothetical protein